VRLGDRPDVLTVSVCLPTRDGAAYIGTLLESLARQTRPVTELVVSDDASTDGTAEIVAAVASGTGLPLVLRRNASPLGAVGNAAACVGAATGDVILPCDQDDVWEDRKIELLLAPIETSDDVIATFSDSSLIDSTGARLDGSLWSTLGFDEREQEQVGSGRGLEVLLRRNVVASHALAYRRVLHDLALPVPDTVRHLDWWLALLAMAEGRLMPIPERLVAYRLHAVNTVGLRSLRPLRQRLDTDAGARSGSDAAMLDSFLGRLRERAPGSAAALEPFVLAKLEHARFRSTLPHRRWRRLRPVLREVHGGAYSRCSNGWRSAALDVLAKRTSAGPRYAGARGSKPDGSVAAVVVNYNAGRALARCVASLRDEGLDEIVVVDNRSTDDSLNELAANDPAVTIVESGGNLGYGSALNAGADRCYAEFLVLCNPDIVFEHGSVCRMVDRLRAEPSAGLVGPRLLDLEGRERLSTRSFPSLRRSWRQAYLGVLLPTGRRAVQYTTGNRALETSGEVDWVTGACLVVRSRAFADVAGFDPDYFMYVEEVDLCWRLHQRGWKVLFEPSARVTHIGGLSSSERPYALIVAHHRSLWRFARRSMQGWDRAALPLIGLGVAARCALVVVRQLTSSWSVTSRASPPPT
jgi:N-acetylglucosaminyl-diphospho-decaprenol L-rhamnosyltransferase